MKLDIPKLESYSAAFAEKVCSEYYQEEKIIITGADILKLTASEQINYFIIKNLFERWKEETAKLRSPFFDFENDDVREALTVFMNKLSRHISVRKEFFKPLVVKAVSDSLAYITQPLEFLKAEFGQRQILSLQEVKEKEKYFRVNKILVQSFLKKLQLSGKTGFSKEESLQYIAEVFKNYEMSLEPAEKFLEQFQVTLKLPQVEIIQPEVKVETIIPKVEVEVKTTTQPIVEKELPVIENTYKKSEFSIDLEKQNTGTLNDLYAKGKQLTLNEVYVHPEDETLLSKARKSKIHDLKAAIPINLRYIFVNELFKGSSDDYNLAISQIERSESLDAAMNIINQLYVKKYDWASDKSEVKEFLELVERRFY